MTTNPQIDKFEKECLSNKILKWITLMIFYVLPSRVSRIFVSLSIIGVIFNIRQDSSYKDKNVIDRIGEILKIHLTDNVLLLPQQTLSWYWTAEFFSREFTVDGRTLTIKQAIENKQDFLRYRNSVLNAMLDALPKTIQRRVKLSNQDARLSIKHNIVAAFMYA